MNIYRVGSNHFNSIKIKIWILKKVVISIFYAVDSIYNIWKKLLQINIISDVINVESDIRLNVDIRSR